MLIGTEGSLLIPSGYPPQLLPEAKFKDVMVMEIAAPAKTAAIVSASCQPAFAVSRHRSNVSSTEDAAQERVHLRRR